MNVHLVTEMNFIMMLQVIVLIAIHLVKLVLGILIPNVLAAGVMNIYLLKIHVINVIILVPHVLDQIILIARLVKVDFHTQIYYYAPAWKVIIWIVIKHYVMLAIHPVFLVMQDQVLIALHVKVVNI